MSHEEPGEVVLTVYSDFLCPWCYIAALRLQRVRDRLPGVTLAWKAFLLRPEPTTPDTERFRAYTQGWARPAAMEPTAGIRPWTGGAPPTHSVPAAVAAKVAASFGAEAYDRFAAALLRAYFAEHRTVSDDAVLVAVAGEAGLPGAEFARLLTAERGRFLEAVFDDFSDAFAEGVTAVPTVAVAGVPVLRGAAEEADYERVAVAAAAAAAGRAG